MALLPGDSFGVYEVAAGELDTRQPRFLALPFADRGEAGGDPPAVDRLPRDGVALACEPPGDSPV